MNLVRGEDLEVTFKKLAKSRKNYQTVGGVLLVLALVISAYFVFFAEKNLLAFISGLACVVFVMIYDFVRKKKYGGLRKLDMWKRADLMVYIENEKVIEKVIKADEKRKGELRIMTRMADLKELKDTYLEKCR